MTPLEEWQALFTQKLAQGHSTLDAIDLINVEQPGLALAAKAEHALAACPDAVPHDTTLKEETTMALPLDYQTREALASVDKMLVRKEIGRGVAERLKAGITAASVAAHPAVPALHAHEVKALAQTVRGVRSLSDEEAEAWERVRHQHLYGEAPRSVVQQDAAPVVKNAADPSTFFTMCAQHRADHPALTYAQAEQAVANSPAGQVCFAAYYAARPHLRGRG